MPASVIESSATSFTISEVEFSWSAFRLSPIQDRQPYIFQVQKAASRQPKETINKSSFGFRVGFVLWYARQQEDDNFYLGSEHLLAAR